MSFVTDLSPVSRRALGRASRLSNRIYTGFATYTRPHSITADLATTQVTQLELYAEALTGATSVVLQGVSGVRLTAGGTIPVRLGITIGGVKYYASEAASTAYKKVTVSLTSALLADASAGAVATLDEVSTFTADRVILKDPEYARITVDNLPEPLSGTQHAQYLMESTYLVAWPENGDKFRLGNVEGNVAEVWPPDSNGFLTVFVGEGRRPKV